MSLTILMLLLVLVSMQTISSLLPVRHQWRPSTLCNGKITPRSDESMDEYRKAVVKVLQETQGESGKLGGRELLELLVRKWGVAYDLQIRKSAPFGEGSANIYVNGTPPFQYFNENFVWDLARVLNLFTVISPYVHVVVMWRYFGQKSFPMSEREYLEHLEAIGRYITAVNRIEEFKSFVKDSRKRYCIIILCLKLLLHLILLLIELLLFTIDQMHILVMLLEFR